MTNNTKLEVHEVEQLTYWHRILSRTCERFGWERNTSAQTFETKKEQYEAWLHDSLLWTIERLQADVPREAIRGLLQAAGYSGQLGGFWPMGTGDCYLTLRNLFERLLTEGR